MYQPDSRDETYLCELVLLDDVTQQTGVHQRETHHTQHLPATAMPEIQKTWGRLDTNP